MKRLATPMEGPDTVAVWGGHFVPQQWRDFLDAWQWPDDEPQWGLWEFVSDFRINDGTLPEPEEMPTLERGEIFGKRGHLRTRRDANRVLWNFTGSTDFTIPKGYNGVSYWKDHSEERFWLQERTALLWGERVAGTDRWHDDRVARATLTYPGVTAERVQIHYKQYTRAGQTAFVWFYKMADHEIGGNDAEGHG